MLYDQNKNLINSRNCECCGGQYATGKNYGGYWSSIPDQTLETKGLCEFCNPAENNQWYNHHKDHIQESCRINTRIITQ